jgi:hypothetical protein
MWRRVGIVGADVSEELVASKSMLEKIRPRGNCSTLKMEVILSPETSVLERSTRYHIPEDGVL